MTVENKAVDKAVEKTVGVLALQGAFIEHINHFEKVVNQHQGQYNNFRFIEVRTEIELSQCDALVIPGGESTAISIIARRINLLEPLRAFVRAGNPVWGTCAGLIMLSRQATHGRRSQELIGGLDVECSRNAFGRQLDSFNYELDTSGFIKNGSTVHCTFIRAPVVTKVFSKQDATSSDSDSLIVAPPFENKAEPKVLARLDDQRIIAVSQGKILGTSFHPELSNTLVFHKWFLDEFVGLI